LKATWDTIPVHGGSRMPIDADEVLRIARLAHLDLDAETALRLAGQLQAILDYVAVLETLDVREVPPTTSASEKRPPLRADEPAPSLTAQAALANAPDAAAGLFRVPRVLGE
jgi:aspartyl-tRNA(Asn)/glutamyl-tRNA(Gln) amidotransferase subunit C